MKDKSFEKSKQNGVVECAEANLHLCGLAGVINVQLSPTPDQIYSIIRLLPF